MVWGCMSAAGTGELQFIEGTMNAYMHCDILKQSMIPSLQRLGCRAVLQHDNDPKHTSKMTTALLKKLRVKVMDWPSMSPDLHPIEHLWGILKQKVEEHKVSNIHQLRYVTMEEWKRNPVATCEALVNSMPKRVQAVLENNGGHTLGPIWTFSLRGVLNFVASGLDINGCVLSYFEETANLHCYYIYIYAFSRCFYPKRLTIAFRLYIFISTCVPWESNPQLFAQLT